jgi:hypothetical protein
MDPCIRDVLRAALSSRTALARANTGCSTALCVIADILRFSDTPCREAQEEIYTHNEWLR